MSNQILNSNALNGTCKEGFRMCPENIVNSQTGWAMCISKSIAECPISDIKISKCDKNPDRECFEDSTKSRKPLNGNNDCLWTTNKCGRGPISRLAIGEGEICRLEKEMNILPNHPEYILMKSKRATCNKNENQV